MTEPVPRSKSRTLMTEYILPTHTNALGTVFGGQVIAWMDLCAAICAERHSGFIAVTATVDELTFQQPIGIGQVARLEATVTAAFRHSLEIEVIVLGENLSTGVTWPCVRAYMTFVPVDKERRPIPVPPLLIENDEDRARVGAAEARRARRLAERQQSATHLNK